MNKITRKQYVHENVGHNFMKDEDGNEYQVPLSGLDLIQQDPDRFKFRDFYGQNPFYAGRLSVAQGGEIVGPGTATSDSIPAMLSDGEFVMTAAANNGAGGFEFNKTKKIDKQIINNLFFITYIFSFCCVLKHKPANGVVGCDFSSDVCSADLTQDNL